MRKLLNWIFRNPTYQQGYNDADDRLVGTRAEDPYDLWEEWSSCCAPELDAYDKGFRDRVQKAIDEEGML